MTPDEEAAIRSIAFSVSPDQRVWFPVADLRRLLATLDAVRASAKAVGSMTEEALTATGDHHILPSGYCLDCAGGCILPLAEANTEAIRRAAYAKPDPFGGAS
jgi:hypothetical protein